jgi:acyltransferase-like protein
MNSTARLPFIDWFKCVGMTLIVYGHTAGWAPLATFPPIYIKQVGVALFLFAAAHSLAREQRRWTVVLFRRLFDVFLFGLVIALLISAGDLVAVGRVAKSNYLPFILGANLLLNQFPANPTTWYIGTYVHFLLLWVMYLRHISVTRRLLAVAVAVEIGTRAFLMRDVGNFVAYMSLSNWMIVFLLGYYVGQRGCTTLTGSVWKWLAVLVSGVFGWLYVADRLPLVRTFPLMQPDSSGWLPLIVTSGAVTAVYVGLTWSAFGLFSQLAAPRVVVFFARNTVLVFIAHMPVCHVVLGLVGEHPNAPWWPTLLLFTLSLPGLALLSHAVHKTGVVDVIQRAVSKRLLLREEPSLVAAASA